MIFKTSAQVLVLTLIVAINISCTRKQEQKDGGSFSFSIPTASGRSIVEKSNSTLALNDLMTVIVNIQTPQGPIVRELDFHDTTPPAGATFSMTIDNVPKAPNLLTQVLAVYEGVGGSMVFKYGDQIVNTSAGGTVRAAINVANIGSSNKQALFAGRYFDSVAPSGPSGTLVAYFDPGGGKPPMAVDKKDIVNGWVSLFMLEGATAALTYKMKDTGAIVFDKLYFDVSGIHVNGTIVSPSAYLAQVEMPATYRKSWSNAGDIESQGEQVFFAGYMQKPGVSVISGHQACYSSGIESVVGSYVDNALTSPLIWSAADATKMHIVGASGVSKNFQQVFGGGSPISLSCDTNANDIVFNHVATSNGAHEGHFAGFEGPFKILNPLAQNSELLSVKWNGTQNMLRWAYMPGAQSGLDGLTIFYKYQGTSSYSGGGDRNGKACNEYAASQGYAMGGDVSNALQTIDTTTVGAETHSGQTLNSGNYYNWSYIVCPFRNVGGVKQYYSTAARSMCVGGCSGNDMHFGWGTTDLTLATNTTYTAQGGRTGRVQSVDTSSPDFTLITLSASAGIVAGDSGSEVMFTVVGEGGGGCTAANLSLGASYSTRMLYGATTTTFRIPKGTPIDGGSSAASELSTAPATSNTFCYVVASKVLHYRDLDIGTYVMSGALFNYSYGDGLLPVRVSGTLTMGSGGNFDMSAMGHSGTSSPSYYGACWKGDAGATNNMCGGLGSSVYGGGGGGGYGHGGDGNGNTSSGGAGSSTVSNSMSGGLGTHFIMGSAGGSASSLVGGAGGGIIYVAANKIVTNGGAFYADGFDGPTSTDGAGGGGGGSIMVYANSIEGSGTNFLARGGNGGSGADQGGVGGGGYVKYGACSIAAGLSVNVSNNKGAAGIQTGATDGNSDNLLIAQNAFWCNGH